jgi:hypothetical protein
MNYEAEREIIQLLKNSSVAISLNDSVGTGFFVAPNLILTCAHVVESADRQLIQVFSPIYGWSSEALVEHIFESPTDLALIRLQSSISDYSCVYLDRYVPSIGQHLYAYGHPDNDYRSGDSITLEFEGESYLENILLYKLKSGEVDFGFSGSAVLNRLTGGVCALVQRSRGIDTDLGARAIAANVILEKIPDLSEWQKTYHYSDLRWISSLPWDIEALDSDWKILNLKRKKLKRYFSVMWFLFKTFIIWSIFGRLTNNSFPIAELRKLFWRAKAGKLGEELKAQKEALQELRSCEYLDTDLSAEELNNLESRCWLIVEAIEIGSSHRGSKEASRIFRTVEVLDEQRTEILDFIESEEKDFPKWGWVQSRWKDAVSVIIARTAVDYNQTEEVLNRLIFECVEELTQISEYATEILDQSYFDLHENLNFYFSSHSYVATILSKALPDMSHLIDLSTEKILGELDREIYKNPTLKLLLKTRILVDFASQRIHEESTVEIISMDDKPPIRVRQRLNSAGAGNKNRYHFHSKCDRYPKIEKPGEKVLCFDTFEDAEAQNHKPCNTCENLALNQLIKKRRNNKKYSQREAALYYQSKLKQKTHVEN